MDSNPLKILITGGFTGICTALSFILVHDALTTDFDFALWEFGITLCVPALVPYLVARFSKMGTGMLLTVAYLTLLMPVLGASFGASGSEPLWQFAILGLAGGVFWCTPFAIWFHFRNRRGN